MPELDRFEKSFRPGWIRPYRLARSDTASDQETSDAIITALCRSLRDLGGVPGIEKIAEILDSRGSRPAWPQFSAIEEIPRLYDGHRHTEVAAQAAKSILVQQAARNGIKGAQSSAKELSVRTCHDLVEHYFLANARSNLIAEAVHADHVEARQWQSRVEGLLADRIERIAEKLVANPRAVGLRAPRRTVPQQSTEDLLNDNLMPQSRDSVALSSTGRS